MNAREYKKAIDSFKERLEDEIKFAEAAMEYEIQKGGALKSRLYFVFRSRMVTLNLVKAYLEKELV